MTYPPEVQDSISVLDKYQENSNLKTFNLLHLYPKDLAYPNGLRDAKWFELWGFDWDLMEKRQLGIHDSIMYFDQCRIALTRIFADGSTLIRFWDKIKVDFFGQEIAFKLA